MLACSAGRVSCRVDVEEMLDAFDSKETCLPSRSDVLPLCCLLRLSGHAALSCSSTDKRQGWRRAGEALASISASFCLRRASSDSSVESPEGKPETLAGWSQLPPPPSSPSSPPASSSREAYGSRASFFFVMSCTMPFRVRNQNEGLPVCSKWSNVLMRERGRSKGA